MDSANKYQVLKSGIVVGEYSTKKRARAAVDKKDNAYGAYVHSIRILDAAGNVLPSHTA